MSDICANDIKKIHGSLATRVVHAGETSDPATGSVNIPIYQTSTFQQKRLGGSPVWEYARTGNPTRAALERLIADLEGGVAGFAFASGMAAITTVLTLLSSGEDVVLSRNVYGGTYRLIDEVFSRVGIGYVVAPGDTPRDFAAALTPNTRAFLIESPANPLLNVIDIAAVCEIAHEVGAICIVDNTFLTPWLQRPLELGADIVIHSATKYLGGHSDVLLGLVVVGATELARKEELATRLTFLQNAQGTVAGPFDSWLVIRGIKTLGVRMDRHVENANRIARALHEHPAVSRIYYPGLSDDPGYETNRRQASGAGGVVSFELTKGYDIGVFFSAIRLITFAESLGGVESLICHPATMTHAAIPKELREQIGITDRLVRLSVGIEDPEDLIEAVFQAIEASKIS